MGAIQVTSSRKGAKSRKHGLKSRSTGTKARARVHPTGEPRVELEERLAESLEQQAATAEVLRIISTSPTKLQRVLEVIVKSAARFCGADDVTIFELDRQDVRAAAQWGTIPQEIGVRFPCSRGSVAGRTILDRKPVHVIDLQADADEFPEGSAFAKRLGHRTTLGVPLLREGVAIGTIQLRRAKVNPFTDKQIALLGTFADQAVIAIENVRLFEAEQQRTRELSESLEQQTATSEVLQVISSSPGELEAVFQAMLANATRICDAKFGTLWLCERDAFRAVALHNAPPAYAEAELRLRPPPDTALGRAASTKQVVQIDDITTHRSYDPDWFAAIELGNYRTIVCVPMLKNDELIGAISIFRQEVRRFTDKQIDLLRNFAAQAVIAIENTRLLNELHESLQRQTATAEVLRVISSSPGELKPVFESMLANATRICEAKYGVLFRYDDGSFYPAATLNPPPAFADFLQQRGRFLPAAGTALDAAIKTKKVIQVDDDAAQAVPTAPARFGGARSYIAVPMLKENEVVGAIVIYRQEVRRFTGKQVELVTNFAAQAVIAIENVRLLNELRESLQQQTATADMLKVISRSTFDLQTVLDALVESAVRLCEAETGHIFRRTETDYELAACRGYSREYEEYMRRRRLAPGRDSLVGRIALEGRMVHISDILADSEYDQPEAAKLGRWRTMIGVPLLREGTPIGALTLTRSVVRPFTDKQIELLTTFADQAVIAIENVRLFDAEQERTQELSEALERQTATSEVLQVIASSPGTLVPVFETIRANATRICQAAFGSMLLVEGDEFRRVALHNAPREFAEFSEKTPRLPASNFAHTINAMRAVQIADMAADSPDAPIAKYGGARTLVTVPMLKQNKLIGVIGIYRQEVRPFTEKQVELVSNFAKQSVIAIENTRLLNELRQRTNDLSESLGQQTATSEVLQVISRSPGELEPVFQTMLENAVRICDAKFGNLLLYDGNAFRFVALHGAPTAWDELRRREPVIRHGQDSPLGRLIATKQPQHIADLRQDQAYVDRVPATVALVELAGARTLVGVPMLKENELIGAIAIYRQEVRPFTDKQVELVTNFAAQAVI